VLDFILGLSIAGLLVRGWLRGFVREILDLVGLIVGLWVAIRLSAPFGDYLTTSFGVTPEVARIGAGVALFLLFGVSMSVAAHYLSKMMSLPGLNLINRAGGAAVAAAWGVALVVVIVNVARVLPLPDSWESQLEESTVVGALAGPGALPQDLFDTLAGDNVLAALASIQDIFGENRAVPEGNEELGFPPAAPDEIRQVRDEAATVVEELNENRAGLGLRPVQTSEAMTRAAEARAEEMYVSGVLSRVANCRTTLAESGAQVLECGQGIALAGSALGGLEGVLESETGAAELDDSAYDRVGVAVVDGPTGRLLMIFIAR
jgi:uncharacterized membrane protein required for colicin V production/uncharacterized protein YkwD